MPSGAGIQSYYEFGVGIPFKKSLWKSIKNRMDFKKYYNVKSVLFLCYNVFRLGCVYCNSAIERILLGSEVSLHNMLFQLAVSL